MDETPKRLVCRVKEALLQRYGSGVDGIYLYGSHARGVATEDSDIDVLVVVHDHLDPPEVRRSLSDLLLDILLEEGELVSVIVIPKSLFDHYNSPFLINARREGVVV